MIRVLQTLALNPCKGCHLAKKERAKRLVFEATTGFEPVIRVLQTLALPLGHVAIKEGRVTNHDRRSGRHALERATGLEPVTFSLARRCSTN